MTNSAANATLSVGNAKDPTASTVKSDVIAVKTSHARHVVINAPVIITFSVRNAYSIPTRSYMTVYSS